MPKEKGYNLLLSTYLKANGRLNIQDLLIYLWPFRFVNCRGSSCRGTFQGLSFFVVVVGCFKSLTNAFGSSVARFLSVEEITFLRGEKWQLQNRELAKNWYGIFCWAHSSLGSGKNKHQWHVFSFLLCLVVGNGKTVQFWAHYLWLLGGKINISRKLTVFCLTNIFCIFRLHNKILCPSCD